MTGSDVRHYLLADSAVATLVGTRIWANGLPQGSALPAIAWTGISGVQHGHLGGQVVAHVLTYQLDCYGDTRGEADALAAAVNAALLALFAACPTQIGPDADVPVCDVEVTGPREDRQPLPGGSDQFQYISSLDVRLWNS
jgi:hypothetical protein